ncbi:MAG: formylglycine-generating enzyme family protein [Planctomycetes bacterium]|nr:formylglycine-generating enzyme family protein [Planctomycetota bacterium]
MRARMTRTAGTAHSLDRANGTRYRNVFAAVASIGMVLGVFMLPGCASQTTTTGPGAAQAAEPSLEPFVQTLEGTTATFEMVPVPAGTVQVRNPDDPSQMMTVEVGPFWVATTETVWDTYDIWVHSLDQPFDDGSNGSNGFDSGEMIEGEDADAISRPSKPYLPPDRGFGYVRYPAISLTFHAADAYCAWLTEKTGKPYRLPTEAEWQYAIAAGAAGPYAWGDDPAQADAYAWYHANSPIKTEEVAQKEPNAWGLFDGHGNVGEWVVGMNGKPIVCGGSYKDDVDGLTLDARVSQTYEWNESDPQIPKSQWWLADCSFVGFRVICIPDDDDQEAGADSLD